MTDLKKLKQATEEISAKINKNAVDRNSYRVIDGVIDPEKYLNAKHRILWILKEANSDTDSWSYLDNFKRKDWLSRCGRRIPTLRRIIYTTYGILNNTEWKDIPWANKEEAFVYLEEIGLINIKKEPGTSSANNNEIQNAYQEDHDLLKRQIDAYDADIIIFGGTFRYFDNADFKGLETAEKEITEFGNHFYNTGEKLYINSWHPAARNKSDKNYVMDIVQIVKNWTKK